MPPVWRRADVVHQARAVERARRRRRRRRAPRSGDRSRRSTAPLGSFRRRPRSAGDLWRARPRRVRAALGLHARAGRNRARRSRHGQTLAARVGSFRLLVHAPADGPFAPDTSRHAGHPVRERVSRLVAGGHRDDLVAQSAAVGPRARHHGASPLHLGLRAVRGPGGQRRRHRARGVLFRRQTSRGKSVRSCRRLIG